MYLNQFTTSNAARLQQILATLEAVHGVKINVDLSSNTAENTLSECQTTYELLRNRIIKESAFNSYQQNPEYIKSTLILEAVKLMLIEIAPKRRRQKKMNESAMENTNRILYKISYWRLQKSHSDAPDKETYEKEFAYGTSPESVKNNWQNLHRAKNTYDLKVVPATAKEEEEYRNEMNESAMDEQMQGKPTLSTQLSAIAAKIPNTGEEAAAFSNILSSIADKVSEKGTLFGNELSPDEKMVLGWIKSLPRPVHIGNMIKTGVEKFGHELVAKRMSHIKSLPKVEIDEISKGSVKNYDDASHKDYWKTYDNADKEWSDDHTSVKLDPDSEKRMQKRERGQELARGKLGVPGYGLRNKVPAIDEISKGSVKNYDDASHKDYWKTYDNADKEWSDDYTSVKLDPDSEKRMQKRERGQELARGKLGVPGYGLRNKVPATEDHSSARMKHIGIDEAVLSPEQTKKIVKLGRAMMDYAEKTPATDDKTLAMMNAFTRVGDKLSQMGTAFGPTGLTDNEKKIVKLAQLKMKNAGTLDAELDEDLEIMTAEASPDANPGMDNVHEQVNESDTLSNMPGTATFGQAHHYEYQASMARSELYRNAKYAMSMMKQVDPNGEIPPWIAGCLTKSANILDKIFHYLDYYKTFEPDQLPENMSSGDMELGETSGSIARENLMLIMEYSTKLFNMIKPGEKLEGWVAMKLTTASECISSSKHYMDYVQFEQHGADEHFDESINIKRALSEDEDPNAQELAKAQIILNAKQISGKIQDIAEEVAKMQVNDLMPLVDSMRTQYGHDAAAGFNETCKAALEQLLTKTTETKDGVDNAITTLQGGGVPAETTDIENAGAPPAGEAPATEEPTTEEPTTEEPATEEPLGRAKKEVAEAMMTCKECGMGTYMEGKDGKMRCDECGSVMIHEMKTGSYVNYMKAADRDKQKHLQNIVSNIGNKDEVVKSASKVAKRDKGLDTAIRRITKKGSDVDEAWNTKMHTAAADVGKWEGYTLAELKARKKKLMDKEERSAKEQKEVRQLNFAIRAKQKDHWGKVKESEDFNPKAVMNRTDKEWNAKTRQQVESAVEEGIFSRKPKAIVTRISPETPEEKARREQPKLKPGQAKVTKITPGQAIDQKDIPAFMRRDQQNEETVDEVAPPGEKAEKFIKQNKEAFKKRYGKRGEAVLYATAWKQFGPKHEGYDLANQALAESKALLKSLDKEFADHKAAHRQKVSEGKTLDVLNVGYGLEGEAIKQKISTVNKKIAEQKSVIRQIMQEGILGMIQNIESLNKANQIAAIKESTPYGVIYNTKSGRKSKKMFESAETRTYWLDLYGEKISNVRMIEPETFDAAIRTKIKGK